MNSDRPLEVNLMINEALTDRYIFKALRPAECADLVQEIVFKGSPVDVQDGFIHLSTYEQLPETLARHFTKEPALWLAAVESAVLGESLLWETSRGGLLFPHLHSGLRRDQVAWLVPLGLGPDGTHLLPVTA